MPTSSLSFADDVSVHSMSRRSACVLLASSVFFNGRAAAAVSSDLESALADRYALMRRAYQTGDVELLRQFYTEDAVVATEGAAPVIGLDAVLAASRVVLPKRRDITVDVLRAEHSHHGDWASHFAKLCAYPRDLAEPPKVGTAFMLWQRSQIGWRCSTEIILVQDMGSAPGFRHAGQKQPPQ